ncbi:MAG TPA: hemerythrin, partial [Firmicutes bacterium]|jgi:hemerythrin|nr:hemerythrin [Bacillota bacterium]
MILKWTEELSTGVNEIDNQHRELFTRTNGLLQAMHEGKGKDEIQKVMSFLDDYVVSHFGVEEEFMTQYNYPGIARHRELHQGFTVNFSDIKRELESDGPSSALVIQTQRKLSDWWINHIATVDKELGAFLVQKTQ